MNTLSIRSASQIALLGSITSNLRAINIIKDTKHLKMMFFYEKINEEEKEIPEIVATEMLSYFENEYEIETQTIILPLNFPIPQEGIRIFCRKEKNLL